MVSTHHTCQQLQQRRSALVPLAALVLLLVAPTPCRAAATVEHSFNSGASWQPAGSIHLQSDEEPAATYERAWGQPQLAALQGLVETDGLYLWRVSLGGAGGLAPVLTSIKAACLAAALTDPELVLQLDAAGRIVSAQISVPASAAPGGSCSVSHALAALKVCMAVCWLAGWLFENRACLPQLITPRHAPAHNLNLPGPVGGAARGCQPAQGGRALSRTRPRRASRSTRRGGARPYGSSRWVLVLCACVVAGAVVGAWAALCSSPSCVWRELHRSGCERLGCLAPRPHTCVSCPHVCPAAATHRRPAGCGSSSSRRPAAAAAAAGGRPGCWRRQRRRRWGAQHGAAAGGQPHLAAKELADCLVRPDHGE